MQSLKEQMNNYNDDVVDHMSQIWLMDAFKKELR
jgi:hypothetical protein